MLTQEELDQIIEALKKEGLDFNALREVQSLEGINTLPAVLGNELVDVPMTLLAPPTPDKELSETSTNPVENQAITKALAGKQETLVSGQNLATINKQSLLGGGDIHIEAGEIYNDGPLKARISKEVNEYNISGINGTTYADLRSALLALNTYMTSQKIHPEVGVKVTFVQTDIKKAKTYSWQKGGTFTSTANWSDVPEGGDVRLLAEAAGAVYHEDTNTWSYEYGGGKIENLTTQDVINSLDARTSIFEERCYAIPKNPIKFNFVQPNIGAIVSWGYNISLSEAFRQNTSIKIAFLGDVRVGTRINYAFNYNLQLEEVVGRLDVSATTSFLNTFENCPKFKKVQLFNLKANVSFKDSPLLYVAQDGETGLGYMIKNANPSGGFTITLAKALEGNSDVAYWAGEAQKKNITIAFA